MLRSHRSRHLALVGLALVTLSPAAAVAQDAAPDPLPAPGTILEPGRYVSRAVGPVIDFRVETDWVAGPSGNGPIFTLEYLGAPGTVLSVTRFDGQTFLDQCDPTSMSTVEVTVPRLTQIIAGNPFLNATAPAVIEIDGHSGLWFDVGVPAWDAGECSLPYLLLWAIPMGTGGEFVQVADQQSRFIILDVNGDVIVVAIESFPGVPFGGFLEAAMELVESMSITPGEYVPLPTLRPEESPAADTSSPSPSPATEDATP